MSVPWALLEERLQYDGYRKITRRTYRLPDGRDADFEIMLQPGVVAILPITVEQTVLLARQFRPGPGCFLSEVPGGAVEPGEEPLEAARRELLEELGCEGDLRFVAQNFNGAYSTMRRYNFVALNCHRVAQPRPDANEFIDPIELSMAAFRDLLRSGQLTDVATGYLGLEYLGLL